MSEDLAHPNLPILRPVSPSPPQVDGTAHDGFFDSFKSLCAKCFRFQIHEPFYDEPHQSCSCFNGAMCCSVGFEGYLKRLVISNPVGFDGLVDQNDLPNLKPKITIFTKMLNLGKINISHLEDTEFSAECEAILLKVQKEINEAFEAEIVHKEVVER